jgi:uncharacterized iron-regulated membrane protein
MSVNRFLRQTHYWLSLVVMAPLAVMIIAGLFLMLKKEVSWIQPETQRGSIENQAPSLPMEAWLEAARAHPETGIQDWSDIDRMDVRIERGIAKILSHTKWEVQIDTATGEVLSVEYRRSDLIEQLHDGSFFADWVKLFIFFPAGILLLIMYVSGVYLFLFPRVVKWKLRRQGPTGT